jgi:teichuronic acid biosynthesis glycosyltransferase TuaH
VSNSLLGRVACISLEAWDTTWRRNQHFAAQLVRQQLATELLFVEPPVLGRRAHRWQPEPGIRVLRPALVVPKRYGGLAVTGALLRARALRKVDLLWVNDPSLGVHCVSRGTPASYDVTDDWRTFDQPDHIVRRIVAAEDALAADARTVVCSDVLAGRWESRYGHRPPVVQNAVDLEAFAAATPVDLPGPAPHVGYVGTLHAQRLDVPLVLEVAESTTGTVHLVGPDALDDDSRERLSRHPRVVLHGAVPSSTVPSWMLAMDVLLCPHLVNEFTLSLDAIKSHEYLASGRPVIATPSSGFQQLSAVGLDVIPREHFLAAVSAAPERGAVVRDVTGWPARAQEFAAALAGSA